MTDAAVTSDDVDLVLARESCPASVRECKKGLIDGGDSASDIQDVVGHAAASIPKCESSRAAKGE